MSDGGPDTSNVIPFSASGPSTGAALQLVERGWEVDSAPSDAVPDPEPSRGAALVSIPVPPGLPGGPGSVGATPPPIPSDTTAPPRESTRAARAVGMDPFPVHVAATPPPVPTGDSPTGTASRAAAVSPPRRVVTKAASPPPLPRNQTAWPHGSRWAVFERLGLGRPATEIGIRVQRLSAETRHFIVTSYRLLGFALLSVIVAVLIGYLTTSVFYFVSDSWIQPMVVSRTDERILSLQAQLAELEDARDSIVTELNHTDRAIEMQQAFQAEFAESIRADLKTRQSALERARNLAGAYAGARESIKKSNSAYARVSRRATSREYRAGLINRSDLLSREFQIAQITNSNLSLAERQSQYEERAVALEKEAAALHAILSDKGRGGALSYEVLRIKQEYERSRLETARSLEDRRRLAASLQRRQAQIDALRRSPYLRVVAEDANVAFVPYDNMDNVAVGESVYACALEMVFCGEVGRVVEILPGEVSFKHVHRGTIVRGQMISIDLDDKEANAAEKEVLFVGGRPLLL